jgi:hypothetical protein
MEKVLMNKAHLITSCFLSTLLACFLMAITPIPANAATVGFNIEITPRTGFFDPNFGTGVSASDIFTGQIFFDTSDLTPDGFRKRTILPGGDELTIAGVSFDSLLNSSFWSFSITGGQPECFDTGIGGGCGTETSQINYDPDNTYPAISFTDTFIGTAFDESQLSMGFNYSISAIPLPPAVWLFGSGLIGLFGLARRKK